MYFWHIILFFITYSCYIFNETQDENIYAFIKCKVFINTNFALFFSLLGIRTMWKLAMFPTFPWNMPSLSWELLLKTEAAYPSEISIIHPQKWTGWPRCYSVDLYSGCTGIESQLGCSMIEVISDFPTSSQENATKIPSLCHECSLPDLFQCTINLPSNLSTL